MVIDPKLLEILACPVCKTKVIPSADEGCLVCRSCSRRYPIAEGGIPVMLAEEATIEPEDHS